MNKKFLEWMKLLEYPDILIIAIILLAAGRAIYHIMRAFSG